MSLHFDASSTTPPTLAFVILVLLVLFLLLILLLLIYFLNRPSRPPCNVPFGPRGHWLFGHAGMTPERLPKALFEWRATHGPVFRFRPLFGRALFVVLNEIDVVREMLTRRDLAGRVKGANPAATALNPNFLGIAAQSASPSWKEFHRFALMTLSGRGLGGERIEQKVVAEADALVDELLRTGGAAFEPEVFLKIATTNVISNVILSERTEYGEPPSRFHEALVSYFDGFRYLLVHPLYNLWPALTIICPTRRVRRLRDAKAFIRAHLDQAFERHELNLDPEDPRDFVDAVILERRRRPAAEDLSRENVQEALVDLFAGGTETTTSALNWVVAWLIHRPEIKAQLAAEVEAEIGLDGVPTMGIIKELPYLRAFLDEVFRRSSIADITPWHRPLVPGVTLGGFRIPEDVNVIPNLWGCHNDPEIWDEPFEFRPERFLDENGRYKKSENLFPFGLGPRRCTGERLALLQVFVFTVRLLQRIEFQWAEGSDPPLMEGRVALARAPEIYRVTAKEAD